MADKKISALTGASTPLAGTEVLPIVQGGTTVKVSTADITAGRNVSMANATVGSGGSGAVSTGIVLEGSSNAAYGAFIQGKRGGSGAWLTGDYASAFGSGDGYLVFGYSTNPIVFHSQSNGELLRLTGTNVQATSGNVVMATAGKGIDFSANTHAAGMTSELLNWYEEGTFTPVFAGLTVGNGSVFGFYRRIGKQVFITYGFITGSSSAVGALTGVSGFPFTTGTVGGSRFFPVTGVAFEGGVGWYGAGSAIFSAATSGIGIFSPTNNVGFSATVPFTWGADDSVSLTATYFVD